MLSKLANTAVVALIVSAKFYKARESAAVNNILKMGTFLRAIDYFQLKFEFLIENLKYTK